MIPNFQLAKLIHIALFQPKVMKEVSIHPIFCKQISEKWAMDVPDASECALLLPMQKTSDSAFTEYFWFFFLFCLQETIRDAIEDSITWPVRQIIPIIPGDYRCEMENEIPRIMISYFNS